MKRDNIQLKVADFGLVLNKDLNCFLTFICDCPSVCHFLSLGFFNRVDFILRYFEPAGKLHCEIANSVFVLL